VTESIPPSVRVTASFRGLFALGALVVVIAGLREAADILVPVAFAAFITVLLSPAVRRLRRWGVPVAIAIPIVILALVALLALVASFVGASVNAFAAALPRYQRRVFETAALITQWLAIHKVRLDFTQLLTSIDASEVLPWVGGALTQVASLLSYVIFVLLMVVFLLFDTVDLPGRLRLAFSRPEAELEQIRLVASEVNHYIVLKTYLCLTTGTATLIILQLLHVDFAPLWALLAVTLGYVPNIGPIVASAPPVILGLLQAGPGHMALVLGSLAILHTVVGNVIEPQLLGRRLGLSSFIVFVSLIVWGWVWGVGGMLLSVPLTMTVKIMLENSREWRWLAILMGSGHEITRPAAFPRKPSQPSDSHST
jgi:predicted PurR-regulated permease PerM